MNILLKNITEIYTMNKQRDLLKNGFIEIENSRISKVGLNQDYSKNEEDFDMVINGEGMIALPGLINCHTHAAMSLLRGVADDLPLKTWLEDNIWPREKKLTADDIYWGSLLAIIEMIKTGTTTFCDMYFAMDTVAKAVKESGMRAVLSQGLIEENDGQQGLKEATDFAQNWQNRAEGRVSTMLAPHAPYTCSKDYFYDIIDLSIQHDLPINIHIAETEYELNLIQENQGATPVRYLESLGLFNRPVIAAHCVYVNDDDLVILKENNVGIAHNPLSNMKLASGVAPVYKMLKKGLQVGLGTDGAASNNNLDLVEEAKMASFLQKVTEKNPAILSIADLLDMLTVNGAAILHLPEIGCLQKDLLADIILVNCTKKVFCFPHHSRISNFIYAGNGSLVDTVIINGKLIMQDRKIITVNEEEVFSQIEKRAGNFR